MVSRTKLLQDICSFSPEQIADAVRKGVVTFYDLKKNTRGSFSPLLQKQVEDLLSATEDVAFNHVETSTNSMTSRSFNNDLFINDASKRDIEIGDSSILIDEEDNLDEVSLEYSDEYQYVKSTVETHAHYGFIIDNRGMFKRPFSFKGRIRRKEYIMTLLFAFIINLIMSIIINESKYVFMTDYNVVFVLLIIFQIPYVWFLLSQGVKRAHDIGDPGFYILNTFLCVLVVI